MPKRMDTDRQFHAAFDAEIERLGLRSRDLPGLAISGDTEKASCRKP